jgi:Neuraminidase (sialidase)
MNPVTVVSSGNVHVVWQDETPGNHDIYYKRSVNNGGTWGRNKRLTRNSGASSIPAIAVLGGNVHLVWVDDTSGEYKIFYRRSTDNGTTWGKKKKIVNLG